MLDITKIEQLVKVTLRLIRMCVTSGKNKIMNYFKDSSFKWRSMMILLATFALVSFRVRPGGESFSVYVNDKMILQHYFGYDKDIKALNLSNTSPNDQLRIHYNECGKIGTDRKISLTDKTDKLIKSWSFADIGENASPYMTVKVKELSGAIGNNQSVKLYYFSKEIANGRLLASVVTDDGPKASR